MNDQKPPAHRVPFGVLLSIIGSIASLVALVLVFIDKLAQSRDADPQLAIWRVTLAIAALLAIAATVTVAYNKVLSVVTSNLTISQKVLRCLGPVMLALLLSAAFADGLYAALYWRWWLGGLIRATSPIFAKPSGEALQKGPLGAISKETLSRLSPGDRQILVNTEVVANLVPSESDQIEGFSVVSWVLKGQCNLDNIIGSPVIGRGAYTVELRSTAFDPYLIVTDRFAGLTEDDDSGGGNNSRVNVRMSRFDDVRIAVTTAVPGKGGSYTLRVRCGA